MSRQIIYNGHTYGEDELLSIETSRSKSMVSESCSIDTLTVELISNELPERDLTTIDGLDYAPIGYDAYTFVNGSDIRNFTPFAPIVYKDGDNINGKFYVTSIERTGENFFKVNACSAVGILDKTTYIGGLFNAVTVSTIIASIIGSAVSYTIDPTIASLPLTGYIPYGTSMEAIASVCFALGIAITYAADGSLIFKYNQPDVTVEIPTSEAYPEGSIDYPTKASKVTVIEHSWYADSDAEAEVLYDNSEIGQLPMDDDVVVFSEPYHSLAWTGTSKTEINCNCVRLTGTGKLTGKKYAHTQREHTKSVVGTGNEMRIEDAYLVSAINANAVLERLWNFYHNHEEVTYSIVSHGNFKCGDLLSFTDTFGDERTGYVMQMDEVASAITKANTVLATNWVPSHLGNDYSHSMIVTANDLVGGVWTVPSEITGRMMVVLFSGMGGGQAGYNGTSGEQKSYTYPNVSGYDSYIPSPGNGGNGGSCGNYGKYSVAEISEPAASYNVSFGQGGAGGSSNGALGSAGGHSTFGSLDTDNGQDLTGEYVNLIDGSVIVSRGVNGISGMGGGTVTSLNNKGSVIQTETSGVWKWQKYANRGGDGSAYGQYRGGYGINGESVERTDNDKFYESAGAAGGGAAYGANGGDADSVFEETHISPIKGGNGANATANPYVFGKTGAGGNGGGGGGAGPIAIGWVGGSYNVFFNEPGNGGLGSAGTKGSDGFAVIYYE